MRYFTILFGILALFLFTGCEDNKENEIDATDDLVLIGTVSDNGLQVQLFSNETFFVGINEVYYRLTAEAGNTIITSAEITQSPVMFMADMNHSCPYTNPGTSANDDNLFECEIVFIMGSGTTDTVDIWNNTVSIHNISANTDHQVVFSNLTVLETYMKKKLTYTDVDSNQVIYLVTLSGLTEPQVGVNDFILTVNQKETMMSFPPVNDLLITINPQMPDMGHGSSGNVDPVFSENGKYEGKVAFNMTGYWTVDFSFSRDGVELGTIQYEFDF